MPIDALRWLRDPEEEKPDALRWLRDPAPAGGGAWEATASPNLQRRRMPDGKTWEFRPTPREGQEPAVTPATEAGLAAVALTYLGGLPERQAETSAGTAMPLQALEAVGAGLKREIGSLADPATYRPGKGFRQGAGEAWAGSPFRTPEPVLSDVERERQLLAEKAVAAGLPAEISASLDTGQVATTALLDPSNLVTGNTALKGLRLARFGEDGLAAQAARTLESGVARQVPTVLDEAAEEAAALAARKRGMATLRPEDFARTLPEQPPLRRLGAGIPDSQIEQALGMRATPEEGAELARLSLPIGEHLPLPEQAAQLPIPEDLVARARRLGTATSDAVRELAGRPWRFHPGYDEGLEVPRPAGPPVAVREVLRDPIPITVRGDDPVTRAQVLRSWDFVSRRHPRLAASVRRVEVSPDVVGAELNNGVIRVHPDFAEQPDVLLHELTHQAQYERGIAKGEDDDALIALQESTAIRRREAYSRVAPPTSTTVLDPRELDDSTLWQRYASASAAPPVPGLAGVRATKTLEVLDDEIIRRAKTVDGWKDRQAEWGAYVAGEPVRPPASIGPRSFDETADDALAWLRDPLDAVQPRPAAADVPTPAVQAPLGPAQLDPQPSNASLPGGAADLSTAPPASRMSTKGIENVAGLQDDLRRVVDENRPAIEAARGPAVPVSRWHDAPALQAKLGLFPEDYLSMPAGRTLNPDEGALGKHYLGQMKRQAKDVEARIASGEVDDMAAAVAEKNARNRDVVKMMAVLQGQGSSEAGRYMRMLQEALDPQGLADTPRERLQLSLLKKYKEANVQTAQRIEQQAVARLQKVAAREARKTQRAATAEELAGELGDLAKQFRDLSRRPRGAAGGLVPMDPDLVEVVGKMAANRVKAGVVAVEELADQVYTAVRMYADDVTREQVKAAIVEHALSRPKKKERVRLTPEQRRLQQAEAAANRAVKALEKRIAAGGAPPAGQASPWSAKLAELKARQAQLRDQLAAMQPPKPALDPEARRLRTRETALARQVEKAEKQLAAGPRIPKASAPAPDSPRIQELRQQLAEVRAQLAADPRQALTQRYRELLDDETVEMIAALPDPTEDPAALLNFLRQMERPTFRDFRTTFWINSILSGSKTTVRNLAGNVVRLAELTAMRPAGALAEKGLARAQGRQAQRYLRETLPATMGVFRGIPEGFRRFAFVMKEGYDPRRIVAELTEGGANKFDMPLPVNPFLLSQNRAVRAIGVPLTIPTRLLEATDALFKTMASTSEMHAAATRTALQEGLSGDALAARVADLLADPTDEMVESAHRFALRATFQDPASWIGDLVSTARRGVPGSDELAERLRSRGGVGNRLVAATVQAPQTAMQHLVPFIHISDRVAATITDYIPLSKPGKLAAAFVPDDAWSGLPAAVERDYRFQPGEAADFLARQTVGAVLGMLGITWAAQGKLVGQAPKDEKLRNDFYADGKQPYSLLIGNRWVPMRDALGPLAGPFVAASMYQDHVRAGEDPTAAIPGMALGSARYMLDASYLATLQQVVEAVEGERGDVGAGVSKASARVVAGYNPYSGLQRGVSQAIDTSTNILGQTGPRVVQREGFVDELKSGIPGLREDLPSRVGTLGEELVQATGRAGAFLPVVPTENRVSLPKQAERIEVLRATLAKKRTEIRRVEEAMANAEKLRDTKRLEKLRARIPEGVNAAMLDGTFERIRAEEQELRLVRSNRTLSREARRQAEAEILERIRMDLEYDLRQVGVQ